MLVRLVEGNEITFEATFDAVPPEAHLWVQHRDDAEATEVVGGAPIADMWVWTFEPDRTGMWNVRVEAPGVADDDTFEILRSRVRTA